jgi:hypothetical protein
MGMFDFFSRRRRRESAVQMPAGDATALGSFAASEGQPVVGGQIGGGEFGGGELGELQGVPGGAEALAALTQLGPMIQQAIATGNVQVQVGEPQAIDMRNTGLGDEIREIMSRHGVDSESGSATQNIDAGGYGAMQQEILAALAKQGIGTEAPSGADFTLGSVQVEDAGEQPGR